LLWVAACGLAPESSFTLAGDSRLPKWLSLPNDARREDVDVTLTYFVQPSGRTFKATVTNHQGRTLKSVSGTLEGLSPVTLAASAAGQGSKYPMYEVAVVNGVPDIVEHRAMEPIFYLTDDSVVWKVLVKPNVAP
jgi:hypothetical protein